MTHKNLSTLSNLELDQSLVSLSSLERETTSRIIVHIAEADRRKLYLEHSYGSLFEYVTGRLGYSAGGAQRRIDASRLSNEVPSLIQDLDTKAISLEQVSLVQRSIRKALSLKRKPSSDQALAAELSMTAQTLMVESLNQQVADKHQKRAQITTEAKIQLLESLKSKSYSESQVIVAKALDLTIQSQSVVKPQADGSVRLEVTFSKDQWEKMNRMRELISHSVPSGSWDQVMEYVAERVIKTKTNVREAKGAVSKKAKGPNSTQDRDKSTERSFYQNRKLLLKQITYCQYQDKNIGKACNSKWQLQVDHVKPRWAGGSDEITNLRVLCGMHNRALYRKQAGIKPVTHSD